jgi:hypothetical protein
VVVAVVKVAAVTRKDYAVIIGALQAVEPCDTSEPRQQGAREQWIKTVHALVRDLERDNPRFKAEWFRRAVGV